MYESTESLDGSQVYYGTYKQVTKTTPGTFQGIDTVIAFKEGKPESGWRGQAAMNAEVEGIKVAKQTVLRDYIPDLYFVNYYEDNQVRDFGVAWVEGDLLNDRNIFNRQLIDWDVFQEFEKKRNLSSNRDDGNGLRNRS